MVDLVARVYGASRGTQLDLRAADCRRDERLQQADARTDQRTSFNTDPRAVHRHEMVAGLLWVSFNAPDGSGAAVVAFCAERALGTRRSALCPSDPFRTLTRLLRLALTHDQKVLVASHVNSVTFFDVEKLTSGQGDSVLGYVDGSRVGAASEWPSRLMTLCVYRADRTSDQWPVIDLKKARASGFDESALLDVIPTGFWPAIPTLSHDGSIFRRDKHPPDVDHAVRSPAWWQGGRRSDRIDARDHQRMRGQRPRVNPAAGSAPRWSGDDWVRVSGRLRPTHVIPFLPMAQAICGSGGRLFESGAAPADNALVVFDARPVRDGKRPRTHRQGPVGRGPTSEWWTQAAQIIVGFVAKGSEVTALIRRR